MITLHHLHQSRSFRVVWLMEELGLTYDLVCHERMPDRTAAETLAQVHPLCRAPVVIDGDTVLFESGAILEYLIHRYGHGRLAVAPHLLDYANYLLWLHAAEGTCMAALAPIVRHQSHAGPFPTDTQVGFNQKLLRLVDKTLSDRAYFSGAEFTSADIMMETYVAAASRSVEHVYANTTNLPRFLARVHARPGYQRAREVTEP